MIFRSILQSPFVLIIIIVFISSVTSKNITTNIVEQFEQNITTTQQSSPNHQLTSTDSINKKPFEFRDVVASYKFYFRGFNGSWISDTEFWFLNGTTYDLTIYNALNDSFQILIDGTILDKWSYSAFKFTKDNSKVLITYDEKNLFRYSTLARYVVFDIKTEQEIDIGKKEMLHLCMWSNNYKDIIYVKDNNVYVLQNLKTEIQLTTTGEKNIIFNGIPDWVYEEEVLKQKEAIWSSPDGTKLAIATFNDTLVEKFKYYYYVDQYPTTVSIRYPKPGRINPNVKLQYLIFNNNNNTIKWYTINPPYFVTADHILRSVVWINNDKMGTFWMNRRQNLSIFQVCDHSVGKCEQPFEIAEPNGWVDISQMICNKINPITQCYFIAFVENWRNIIKFNVTTGQINGVYPAEHTVLKIYGLKEDNKTKNVDIFYSATTVENNNYQHVYKNGECLTCNLQGPEGINCSFATAKFSKKFSYYSVTCSGPTPKYSKLFRTSDNKEIFNWNENLPTRKLLNKHQKIQIINLNVPVTGGFEAAVKIYLPNEIDLNNLTNITKTYPMILDVYGGPNSVRVNDEFSVAFKDYLITNYNLIYCKIDGRGSGNKGKKLLYTINNGIGTVEVEDQLTVTKYLHKNYKFIDENRTAIWGWSYGGFVTAMALGMDNEKLFQCGISVAPVTNWFYYDSIYTERFMGLPVNNWAAYNKTDISKHLTNLSKHKFLLMHGAADDNVHIAQSMLLTKVLVKKDIDFDQMYYTNEGHSMMSVHNHIYHTMEGFWKKCLKLEKLNYTSLPEQL